MAFGYCVQNLCSGLAAADIYISLGTPSDPSTTTRLCDGRLGRVVTSSSTSLLNLVIDLGSSRAVSVASVLNHNLADLSVPEVRVLASEDETFATGIVTAKDWTSVSALRASRRDTALVFPAVTKRFWLIQISVSADSLMRIGEVFLGASVTGISRGSAYGSGESVDLATSELVTRSGDRLVATLGGQVFERRYSFADWSASELEELHALWDATSGPTSSLLWIDNVVSSASAGAAADTKCLLGRISGASFAWVQDDFGVYQPPSLVIRSLARGIGT